MLYAAVEEGGGLGEADPAESKFLLGLSVDGVDLLDCMKRGGTFVSKDDIFLVVGVFFHNFSFASLHL